MKALNACPGPLQVNSSCKSSTDWLLDAPVNTKVTISERRATTAFDRSNLTIIDILEISNPAPTNYTPNDFFVFYDIIFGVDESEPFYNLTAQYLLISQLDTNLTPLENPFDLGSAGNVLSLRQVLTAVPLIFNNMYWSYPFPYDNMGKSVALAIPGYKVGPISYYAYY
jgi:hypothetical protein